MAENISNIDELLITGKLSSSHPASPELQPTEEAVQEVLEEIAEVPHETSEDEYGLNEEAKDELKEEAPKKEVKAVDEYGNEKEPPRTYTQDEVDRITNEKIRERLARLERNNPQLNPAAHAQVQQATNQGFEYNAESNESWQIQLESFVEQTVSRMGSKQAQQAQQMREQQAQSEFDTKFTSGMGKFNDYKEVVGKQPITDAMVLAARSIADPAAFFYAAAKRNPQDLERISRISDPYAQIAEIGKLEERMKKGKPMTRTPKPISKTNDDLAVPHKANEKKQPTIEELIQQSAAKKLALQKQRQR